MPDSNLPDWKNIVQQRLQPLGLEANAESSLAEELAQHLEDHHRDLRDSGVSHADALRRTLAELNDMNQLKSHDPAAQRMPKRDAVPAGDIRPGNPLTDLWRDLRYSFRGMRKSPLFVLVVLLTLALGIGANTTVFTVINTLILNPLPIPDSSGLTGVARTETAAVTKRAAPLPLSYADLRDYQTNNQVFQSLAGYTSPRPVTLQTGPASQRMFVELVTGNYFPTLGLTPAHGRFFLPEEDGTSGAHPVAVMSHATWQGRFGGAADIVGRTLRVNNLVLTVVGVASPNFIGVNVIFGPDLWIPGGMAEQLFPNEMPGVLSDRAKTLFQGLGRLKPNTTRVQAQANLTAIAADLARAYPAENEGRGATVLAIRDALLGSGGKEASPIVLGSAILLAVVGIVLLIACSNVANLLLARSAARRQEITVRLAMGASRNRLLRQLLTESVLLGCLGGALGLGVGYLGLRLVFGALPAAANFVHPKLDLTVLAFSLAISLATGFLFGIIPAFQASRTSVAESLKEEARTTGRSRRKLSLANALLTGQVAFSFLLLVTAALFLRSIQHAYNADPGFQTAHLAVFPTNPGQAGYTRPQATAFYKEARERAARIPGVEAVSWSSNMPLWANPQNGVQVEGREQRSRTDKVAAIVNTVDRGYFDTMGVVIESGRAFTGLDRETSLPVAIVNRKMADDYWPSGDAIGKRIQLPGEKQMRQIVGIARTANYTAWAEPPQPCIYVPLEQHYSDAMTMYVRSKAEPQPVMMPVQREIVAAGPKILATDMRTGRQIIDGGLFQPKMGVALLSVFGLLALGLASIGLYGILAYSVNLRKREIGVRMALGAAQTSVLRLVLQQGMTLVLAGVTIGFVASLFVGRLLARMLFGVGAADPISVAAAAAVLLLVGFVACYLPARRASRVDPLVALREG